MIIFSSRRCFVETPHPELCLPPRKGLHWSPTAPTDRYLSIFPSRVQHSLVLSFTSLEHHRAYMRGSTASRCNLKLQNVLASCSRTKRPDLTQNMAPYWSTVEEWTTGPLQHNVLLLCVLFRKHLLQDHYVGPEHTPSSSCGAPTPPTRLRYPYGPGRLQGPRHHRFW